MVAVIKTEGLTRKLDGELPVTLVNNISLEIQSGEFVVISGPSGSGKSSLLYLLGLLDRPTSGKIWLNDIDTSNYIDKQLADIRLAYIGFVFQFHFLLPEFTALENVMLPMKKLGSLTEKNALSRAQELLESLGLKDQMHKVPKQLSGGQSQRVAIARALANKPKIILADEPTGNLDSASGNNVRSILKDLSKNNDHTVIIVTHDSEFSRLADRVITIVDGKISTPI